MLFVDAIPLPCVSMPIAPCLLENELRCYCVRISICVSGLRKKIQSSSVKSFGCQEEMKQVYECGLCPWRNWRRMLRVLLPCQLQQRGTQFRDLAGQRESWLCLSKVGNQGGGKSACLLPGGGARESTVFSLQP